MSNQNHPIKKFGGGFFNEIGTNIRLVIRLIADRRVSPFLKLIPIGTFAYLLIPDLIIGPIDDFALVGLGLYLFVELCPQEIVEEHRRALSGQSGTITGQWQDPKQSGNDEIIDAEFVDKK